MATKNNMVVGKELNILYAMLSLAQGTWLSFSKSTFLYRLSAANKKLGDLITFIRMHNGGQQSPNRSNIFVCKLDFVFES